MKKKEYILINIKGAKSFQGYLRWNIKLPSHIAAPLFPYIAQLIEYANKEKSNKK